ncbi:hypothetical protein KC218_24165, partial [Mycobacterium tuberculosis]|nr:hypothetical protein [Mycobacterium tuberculosis]
IATALDAHGRASVIAPPVETNYMNGKNLVHFLFPLNVDVWVIFSFELRKSLEFASLVVGCA